MLDKLLRCCETTRQFGIPYTLRKGMCSLTGNRAQQIDIIENYLSLHLADVVEKYAKMESWDYGSNCFPVRDIWVCWLQGAEKMPRLCKACYKRLRNVVGSSINVNLITLDNYHEFVSLPEVAIASLGLGKISYTHFSDILRHNLLVQQGGIWLDSTIWCDESIDSVLDLASRLPFWSVKLESVYNPDVFGQLVSRCQWSSFIIKGTRSIINSFVCDAMEDYLKQFDVFIDYYQQNYLIKLAYDKIPLAHKEIERIQPSNPDLYKLKDLMRCNCSYDREQWTRMTENTQLFKLSWKEEYQSVTSSGEQTWSSYILGEGSA